MLLFTFEKNKEYNVCNKYVQSTQPLHVVHSVPAFGLRNWFCPGRGSRFAVGAWLQIKFKSLHKTYCLSLYISIKDQGELYLAARNAGGVDDVTIPVYDFTKTRCHISNCDTRKKSKSNKNQNPYHERRWATCLVRFGLSTSVPSQS